MKINIILNYTIRNLIKISSTCLRLEVKQKMDTRGQGLKIIYLSVKIKNSYITSSMQIIIVASVRLPAYLYLI